MQPETGSQNYAKHLYTTGKRKETKEKEGAKNENDLWKLTTTFFLAEVTEDNDEKEHAPLPPLFVYFDIEAMQDGGKHVANLLCAEVDDHNEPIVFQGTDCVESFINGFEN